VQAEAPPEALFSKFKAVAMAGAADPADIAFYFVHWLTDLAAAVPTPLEGAEKFVLKFPRPVLGSFIKSFGVLNELAVKTETEVFESYLDSWWSERTAIFGPVPEGPISIAIMRLVVQSQAEDKQRAIHDSFYALRPDDRQVLAEEMANSGLVGQHFQRSLPLIPKGGPSILVYYSPAFVRTLAPSDALAALSLLAEIYRRARELWPNKSDANGSVTVRIDQIKELPLAEIQQAYAFGDTWVLTKRNELEAVLERIPLDQLAERAKTTCRVLKFWKRSVSKKDQIASAAMLADSSHNSSPSGRSTPKSGRSTPASHLSDQTNTSFTKHIGSAAPARVI